MHPTGFAAIPVGQDLAAKKGDVRMSFSRFDHFQQKVLGYPVVIIHEGDQRTFEPTKPQIERM